jgi:hypothetical protein
MTLAAQVRTTAHKARTTLWFAFIRPSEGANDQKNRGWSYLTNLGKGGNPKCFPASE